MAYVLLAIGGFIMLLPFYLMFVYASHTIEDILSVPAPFWFGSALSENLAIINEKLPYFNLNIFWSTFIAVIVTLLNLFFCSLTGFAFAMYEFKYKNILFTIILSTMLIPPFLSMIPTALIMSFVGWMNDPKALIIPSACGAMGVFMMRQYISSSIPKELIEAARIDNCGEFTIFWRVVVPLITPAFGTLGLVTFIASWNNFMGPLVVMNDMKMFTIPLALRGLQGTGHVPWGAVSAGAAISVIPLLIIFVMASRKLIDGLTSGAVKG
ncbi:carbohydrate ABC transporter permease [Vibrio sp. WXL103]|uniref:carbohydrate ABC transporter permease n=1 Tax=Vibrio sp. WXL103 TaxID=3450710 RepID=UPI003EC845D8